MKRKRHPIRNFLFCLAGMIFFAAFILGGFFGIKGYGMYRDAISGQPLSARVEEIRDMPHFTSYSELPDFYRKAVLSIEDRRFEKHCGIDPIAICRALWIDLKTQSLAEGGSTITQQLAKNMLFTQDKKIERKAAEVFAAFALEADYNKQEILELYVNTAYFGSGYYGIYAAAMGYFNKQPSALSDYEAAMLAGLPNAPSVYSPDISMELAIQRTSQVLQSMVKNKLLTQDEANGIMSSVPRYQAGNSLKQF